MRERFNGFRQVVSERKIVINVPLFATTIAEAPHAWGAAGGALERWFYSHSVVASVVEQGLKTHGYLTGIVLKGQMVVESASGLAAPTARWIDGRDRSREGPKS